MLTVAMVPFWSLQHLLFGHHLAVHAGQTDQDVDGHAEDGDNEGVGGQSGGAVGLSQGPDYASGGPGREEEEDEAGDQHPDLARDGGMLMLDHSDFIPGSERLCRHSTEL